MTSRPRDLVFHQSTISIIFGMLTDTATRALRLACERVNARLARSQHHQSYAERIGVELRIAPPPPALSVTIERPRGNQVSYIVIQVDPRVYGGLSGNDLVDWFDAVISEGLSQLPAGQSIALSPQSAPHRKATPVGWLDTMEGRELNAMVERTAESMRNASRSAMNRRVFYKLGHRPALFQEVVVDGRKVISRRGIVGEKSEMSSESFKQTQQAVDHAAAVCHQLSRSGYTLKSPAESFATYQWGSLESTEDSIRLRHEIEDAVDEELRARGLGVCEESATNLQTGASEICCKLVDFPFARKLANKVVETELERFRAPQPWSEA